MLARLPLVLVGWYEEKQLLKVPLFKGYKEMAGAPFCVFRVALMVCAYFTLPPFCLEDLVCLLLIGTAVLVTGKADLACADDHDKCERCCCRRVQTEESFLGYTVHMCTSI